MCGTYQEKFDGELSAALATEEDGYVLAVHQGMNAFTLFLPEWYWKRTCLITVIPGISG
ncbi:MAG: hypothetical protein ACLTSZ_10010 [Lachnospiraceae bacterium]